MKAVDFHHLPRAIQDRFVGSVMSGFPPAPLLVTRGVRSNKLVWLGVSGACFVALVLVTRIGYGSLDSSLALHSWLALILYAALVGALAFGLERAFASVVRERGLPYAPGVYLFPACLVDARTDEFTVYPIQELAGLDAQGASIRVAFAGGSQFFFGCADPRQAHAILAEVQGARENAIQAIASGDPQDLVSVDPLANPRFSSPVGPREAYEAHLPPWKKLGPVVAVAVAAIFAPTLWALRNNGSDKTMYARATQANDTASYRAYLERGSRFKEEVAGTLLPRAELRDAERAGSVAALLEYKAEHRSSKIGPEIALSIRTAMLAELEKAKAAGTLAALDDFAKRYTEHGVEPELREAIHALYTRELDAYKKRAVGKERGVIAFAERLFAWSEKRGPKVEVRFRRKKSESLGRADSYVAKTPSFMGEVSYPSRQFDDKHCAKREAAFGKTLTAKLDAGLSSELFDVTVGLPVSADDALPDVKVPTLFITYAPEWSGQSYVSHKPRGSYIGVLFPFEAMFVIPGDPKPMRFKTDITKQPALGLLKEEEGILPGPAEEKVYDALATDAFDQFGSKLLSLFFAREPKEK